MVVKPTNFTPTSKTSYKQLTEPKNDLFEFYLTLYVLFPHSLEPYCVVDAKHTFRWVHVKWQNDLKEHWIPVEQGQPCKIVFPHIVFGSLFFSHAFLLNRFA